MVRTSENRLEAATGKRTEKTQRKVARLGALKVPDAASRNGRQSILQALEVLVL